ncbi:hypothetical protein HKD37_20G055736 [Glycine soja]
MIGLVEAAQGRDFVGEALVVEWAFLEREESKEFSDCVVLNSLTREKGDTKEFRRLVLCSFGKGRRETQKEFSRLVLGKFFLAKGEEMKRMNRTSFLGLENQKTLENFMHKEEEEEQRDSKLVKVAVFPSRNVRVAVGDVEGPLRWVSRIYLGDGAGSGNCSRIAFHYFLHAQHGLHHGGHLVFHGLHVGLHLFLNFLYLAHDSSSGAHSVRVIFALASLKPRATKGAMISSDGALLIGLIRQVCEVLIFTLLLSQSSGLASHPLSATLLG